MIRQISEDIELIFLTGYSEYALNSFEVYPFNYLVKPIDEERLLEVIGQATKKIKSFTEHEEIKKIAFNEQGKIIQIPLQSIIFIEKIKKTRKSQIYCDNSYSCIVSLNLNELEEQLTNEFVRCHKSFIVNTNKILEVKNTCSRNYEVIFKKINKTALSSVRGYKRLRKIIIGVCQGSV